MVRVQVVSANRRFSATVYPQVAAGHLDFLSREFAKIANGARSVGRVIQVAKGWNVDHTCMSFRR